MTEPTTQIALRQALAHHSAGRLMEAEAIYRQVLLGEPNQPDALHLLGVIADQAGQSEDAERLIGRAISVQPRFPAAYSNLGVAQRKLGKLDAAAASYQRAIQLDPVFVDAILGLAEVLKRQGKIESAVDLYCKAALLRPGSADIQVQLGVALRKAGRLADAIAAYQQAIQLKADCAVAYNNLGNVYRLQGKLADALATHEKAIGIKADFLGYYNMGNVLKDLNREDEAIAAFTEAIRLEPGYSSAHINLGNSMAAMGNLDEALACFERATAISPNALLDSARLFMVYQHPDYDERRIVEEHRRWNEQYARHLREPSVEVSDARAERRLRLGYVSASFRDHVLGRNVFPLIREHDHQQFEIFCYHNYERSDSLTERFRALSDGWRDVSEASDEEMAGQIRADKIDILIDLELHTGNRLLAFARKPAPIQATFAGYPAGTGLTAMDYRLTDPHLDPPGRGDEYYVERSIRLPDSFWCYDPEAMMFDTDNLEPGDLPALANRFVTFGSLNSYHKINPPLLKLWASVLLQAPESRLLLLDPKHRQQQAVMKLLEDQGIEPRRVSFLDRVPRRQYMGYYQRIDLGLDTSPYNGHTTSLDSLWMGVPVVTLAGRTVVGRAGVSQLNNLGLPELIAQSPGEYVRIATGLAGDLPRLAELRGGLRRRMLASPLTDAKRFTRNIETAYRQMWRTWCGKQG